MKEIRIYMLCLNCGKEYPLDLKQCTACNHFLYKCTDEMDYTIENKKKFRIK